MKITNLSKAIGLTSFLIISVSIIQWFFLYPDISQLALGGGIGIVFIGFAYLHSLLRKHADDIRDLNSGLDAFRKCYADEFEKIKEKLK